MDKLSTEQRSENMRRIKSNDSAPEMAVRRLAHGMGYRFRLHRKDLPGKPDLVFPGLKKAIFVHGCFWHRHEDPTCLDGRIPKSRPEYWIPKLSRNQERDRANLQSLAALGWKTLVIWECDVNGNTARLVTVLERFLGRRPARRLVPRFDRLG